MSEAVRVDDRMILTAVVRLLLEGTEVSAFQYDSGFTLHFQRPLPDRTGLPIQVSLVLKARWWVGDRDEIPLEMNVKDPALLKCGAERPYQAFKLMTFVGHTVKQADVDSSSNLRLLLSQGEVLTVQGVEPAWEFSWYLFVPSEIPGVDSWAVNCDSSGSLEGSWPQNAPIPTGS